MVKCNFIWQSKNSLDQKITRTDKVSECYFDTSVGEVMSDVVDMQSLLGNLTCELITLGGIFTAGGLKLYSTVRNQEISNKSK